MWYSSGALGTVNEAPGMLKAAVRYGFSLELAFNINFGCC